MMGKGKSKRPDANTVRRPQPGTTVGWSVALYTDRLWIQSLAWVFKGGSSSGFSLSPSLKSIDMSSGVG